MATTLLVLALVSLFGTFTALFVVRPLGLFMPVYFFSSWLQGELAPWHLIWQSLVAVLLVAGGALEQSHGQWGLFLLLLSFTGLAYVMYQSFCSRSVYAEALNGVLGEQYQSQILPERRATLSQQLEVSSWMKPFSMRRQGVRRTTDISYGDAGERNLLDIYYPDNIPEGGCPVLIHVHGGAWMIGHQQQQAQPLINHLVPKGWVCIDINYRLSPAHRFPAHIIDVKKAIAWVKMNIHNYGGDPGFVALTGGSAGGHLSCLASLSANNPEFQPGFEDADTTVQAGVPIYGVFDWAMDLAPGDEQFRGFISKNVLHEGEDPVTSSWLEKASPVNYINPDAPPMLFVHGTNDALAKVEDARIMTRKLAEVSESPVVYAEIPGGQHAFEMFHSIRSDITIQGVHEFLEWAYSRHQEQPDLTV
jgi:acetyl esterase/lipase